jgi:imidazole glycerol-phosphate synthase subunit HisF
MLRPRVIPCLLVRNNGLIKTRQFGEDKYVGDPINAVRIFNEKEADELIVLDIDASAQGREPDYRMIENLAAECRMPLCYGGGITSAEQARRIMGLGVEKVSLSTALLERPALVTEIAEQVGSQSVVAVLDVRKRTFGGYHVYSRNGTRDTGRDPVKFAAELEKLGAGEIVINSIDQDGAMKGYDLKIARQIRAVVHVPLTLLGGAGSLADIRAVVDEFGLIGAAAGSLFVFKGTYRAVLINYPSRVEREVLCGATR